MKFVGFCLKGICMRSMRLLAQHKLFDGEQRRYCHFSNCNQCDMTFSIFLPALALQGYRVPVIYCLSGLTCTDENFSMKSGAQRWAASWGIVLVMPDTSPHGTDIVNDSAVDLGQGASFYVNATEEPWAVHYQMYDYVAEELPRLIESSFSVSKQRGLCGHSMGGHGALMLALRNPHYYASVSALAPVTHPSKNVWGQKAFRAYLGNDEMNWKQYDSTLLIANTQPTLPILIDQGTVDEFYPHYIDPQPFVQTARAAGFQIQYYLRAGYDHSYYFVSSFIESHIAFHAEAFKL